MRPSPLTAPVKCGAAKAAVEHAEHRLVFLVEQQPSRCAARSAAGATWRSSISGDRSASNGASRSRAAVEQRDNPRRWRRPPPPARSALLLDLRADARRTPIPSSEREQRAEQENRKVLLSTVAVKSRRAMTKAARIVSGSFMRLPPSAASPISRAAASPAMAMKASCSPGRSMLSVSIPAPPSISALSNGSGPLGGSSNVPFAADPAWRRREAPRARAVLGAGAQMDDRAKAAARLVDRAFERDLALGDDRDPLAQPLGMGDDMGREDDVDAVRGLVADQLLELLLVDRVEPGERLVEHDQFGLVDDRAEQLDGLRHALGQGADRLLRPIAEAMRLRAARPRGGGLRASGRPRSAPMKAIASTRRHRRIEAALLGQIADLAAPPRAAGRGRAACACPSSGR